MHEFDTDIALVGGGMVGITAALLLAQAVPQLRIALLENFPLQARAEPYQPSFDQRATAIATGSLELLAPLDLVAALRPHSGVIRQVEVSDKGHWGQVVIDAAEQGVAQLGLVVPNALLGQVLLQRLAESSVQPLAPVQVQQVQPLRRGYRLHLQDGASLSTRLLVLADGAQSRLAMQLGVDYARTDYGQHALIANLRVEQPHQGRAFERFTDTGPMALLPLADGHEMALVWTLPEAQADSADWDDQRLLGHLQDRFGQRLGAFTAMGRRDSYPLTLLEAKEQVRSHLVLLGNAAHFLHPVAGQGFNLSARDIQALVACVRATWARESSVEQLGELPGLLAYQARRARDQWLTVQYSHQLVSWFSSPAWPQVLPRQLGLMALNLLPAAKRLLADQSMGRGLHG